MLKIRPPKVSQNQYPFLNGWANFCKDRILGANTLSSRTYADPEQEQLQARAPPRCVETACSYSVILTANLTRVYKIERAAAAYGGISSTSELTTPGIPCIYYGTEQCFDGNEGYHDYSIETRRFAEDRYIREGMFGGEFGAFGTQGCHFFNSDHPTFKMIKAVAKLRQSDDIVGRLLRGGHVFLRETSFCGYPFSYPPRGELAAWSRVLSRNEILIVLNTNAVESRGAEVTVDAELHQIGSTMKYLFRSDRAGADSKLQQHQQAKVQHHEDGRATVFIELPPATMAIVY